MAANGKVKRRILGEQIVKGIRFPAMEEKEFASFAVDCNLLTKKELGDLMKTFNVVMTSSMSLSEDRRARPCQSCCRFNILVPCGVNGGWNIEDVCERIRFWVDKDVMLHGEGHGDLRCCGAANFFVRCCDE